MKIQDNILVSVHNEDIIDGKFIVPEGIESIGDGAFRGCTSLQHIEFPASLRSIGSWAFWGCTSLQHIVLPASVRSIGVGAFRDCTSLQQIILPEVIESIGNWAFAHCAFLTHIEFPDSLEKIGSGAFRDCTYLQQIILPSGKQYEHRCVDGYSFLIDGERQVGNTTIFKGLLLNSYQDGKVIGENCFVAEREGITAHGETIKEAMEDLEFKIVQDRLQNSPLSMDDLIDVNHYRAITGACRIGVSKWMEENNVQQEKILVKDLLPLLEKTNAYGVEKFKKLIK